MRSNQRKSSELRERLGDPAKGKAPTARGQNKFQSEQQGISPIAPSGLMAAGKTLWEGATANATWLTASDAPALLLACQLADEIRAERMRPQSEEMSRQLAATLKMYQTMLNDLGLTPRSRINLGLAVIETESKLSAFKKEAQ